MSAILNDMVGTLDDAAVFYVSSMTHGSLRPSNEEAQGPAACGSVEA